jgi:hypothetical protein
MTTAFGRLLAWSRFAEILGVALHGGVREAAELTIMATGETVPDLHVVADGVVGTKIADDLTHPAHNDQAAQALERIEPRDFGSTSSPSSFARCRTASQRSSPSRMTRRCRSRKSKRCSGRQPDGRPVT